MGEWAGVDKFRTGFTVDEYRFIWEIENFEEAVWGLSLKDADEMNELLENEKITVATGHKIGCSSKWELFMERGVCGCAKSWILLVADPSSESESESQSDNGKLVHATLEVEKSEGCSVLVKQSSSTFKLGTSDYDGRLKLQLFQYADSGFVKMLKANNGRIKLYLKLKLMVTWNRNEEKLENLEQIEKDLFLKRVANLQSDEMYDVTFQVGKSGTQIGAHRAILAARSPVFSRMFQNDMIESNTGNVQIEDLSKKALEVIIHFVYHGTLENDWGDVVDEVAYGAEKYELNGLTELVNQRMIGLCNEDNARELLEVATTYRSLSKAKIDIEKYLQR